MLNSTKITDYEVISYTCFSDSQTIQFYDTVQKLIKNGWQPYGELIVSVLSSDRVKFTQAMVKAQN